MPADRLLKGCCEGRFRTRDARARAVALPIAIGLCALCAAECTALHPEPAPKPAPPPAAAPAPQPAPAPPPAPVLVASVKPKPDGVNAADQAARRLLAYHERLRRMSPTDVAAEVSRLNTVVSSADPASPDDVLALALALVQEHNAGDLARASSLLEPLAQDAPPTPEPWQPLARLLLGRVSEQRRLEEQLDKMTAQRRDTQRAIQQLTEKLEALKAIERSMTAHPAEASPPVPGSAPGADSTSAPAPKP